MGFLERLERAIEERLEPSGEHPYEQALALWRLLLAHPRPGGFCPNRMCAPTPLDQAAWRELAAHIEERGFRLPAQLHQVTGPLGVTYAATATSPDARLLVEVLDGPSAGKLALTDERLVIGRGDEVDLRLGDPTVSRRHCSVNAQLELVDLGSRLGVHVAGRRVSEARLADGQRFGVGEQQLQVRRLA